MTVGDLKKLLDSVPDKLLVCVDETNARSAELAWVEVTHINCGTAYQYIDELGRPVGQKKQVLLFSHDPKAYKKELDAIAKEKDRIRKKFEQMEKDGIFHK